MLGDAMDLDVLPLCPSWVVEPSPRSSLGRGTRQRVQRRRAHQRAATDCVAALNARGVGCEKMSQAVTFLTRPPTAAQQLSVTVIWEATSERRTKDVENSG